MSDITPVETRLKQAFIGDAKKLVEHAKANPEKNFVLFSGVKVKVLPFAYSAHLNYPFDIIAGKSTPLGLFANSSYIDGQDGVPLEVLKGHKRSALLARVIFNDDQGNVYRDVDIKGAGFIVKDSKKLSTDIGVSRPGKSKYYKNSGLLNKDEALTDFEYGERLAWLGVRVARTIAIAELEEIIVDGEKISVAQAKKKGIIDKKLEPVIQIRAFGTRARINDAHSEQSRLLLDDAKKLVAQELGKESMTDDEYCDWFAQTLGKNVALLHDAGFVHGVLSYQNITLDCRLVDFATVPDASELTKPEIDVEFAIRSLEVFSQAMARFSAEDGQHTNKLKEQDLYKRLVKVFTDSYQKHIVQD